MKKIEVTISQTLSSTQYVEVEDNFDETNDDFLKDVVIEQIMLPSDCTENNGYHNWEVDDLCVILG